MKAVSNQASHSRLFSISLGYVQRHEFVCVQEKADKAAAEARAKAQTEAQLLKEVGNCTAFRVTIIIIIIVVIIIIIIVW